MLKNPFFINVCIKHVLNHFFVFNTFYSFFNCFFSVTKNKTI